MEVFRAAITAVISGPCYYRRSRHVHRPGNRPPEPRLNAVTNFTSGESLFRPMLDVDHGRYVKVVKDTLKFILIPAFTRSPASPDRADVPDNREEGPRTGVTGEEYGA